MKRTLLITLILVICTMVFATEQMQRMSNNRIPQSRNSRTQVIAYQETFETGAVDWTFSPTTAANLWHVGPVADAPSPTTAMINQNENGSYNPSMNNFLYSPQITLPLSGEIKADFMMKGNFDDTSAPTSASVLDYWYWDISVFSGTGWSAWYRMNNPYNTAGVTPIVYIDAPTEWSFVTESYSGLDGIISNYAGQTVKFRICFRSDADTPIGTGIMIDNFTIYNDIFIPSPTSLTGQINGSNVDLSWTAPPSGMSAETLTSTNSQWSSFVSDAEAYAMKITNPTNAPLQLHGVNFMLYRTDDGQITATPSVHVYADEAGLPGAELATVTGVTNITNNVWKTVDITSQNVMIPAGGSLFVGISDIAGASEDQGLLCDSTSTVANSYALGSGVWDPLGTAYEGLVNCGLAGVYWVDDALAPVVTGYKVYRTLNPNNTYEVIGTIDNATTVTYTDASPVAGSINYYKVSAMFGQYESELTDAFSIDLIGLLYSEISVDDGTSNQNFNVGSANSMAIKLTAQPNLQLHYVKVYLNTVGSSNLIIRIYNNNGEGGLPGSLHALQFTTPASQLVQGWNSIALPTANLYNDADGIFYIAIVEFANPSVYALDTDTNGNSYKKIGTSGAWTAITEGNIMVRGLIDYPNANEDLIEVAPVSDLTNYPNPFNQITNISFDVRKAGFASLKVYNLKGQLVRTLSNGMVGKGIKNFNWDGMDEKGNKVGLGVYFCQLESNGKTLTKKVIKIK